MRGRYHRQITTNALEKYFCPSTLAIIIQANLHQDSLKYLLGAYPHYHFDDSAFDQTYTYLEDQREIIFKTLIHDLPIDMAWKAFGRISHTVQDFYAHSNYVRLWWQQNRQKSHLRPDDIDPLLPELINHPHIITGRVILTLEILGLFPILGKLFTPLFPADTHIRMNLDHPKTGPLFPFAFAAATKRTMCELEQLSQIIQNKIGQTALNKFMDCAA